MPTWWFDFPSAFAINNVFQIIWRVRDEVFDRVTSGDLASFVAAELVGFAKFISLRAYPRNRLDDVGRRRVRRRLVGLSGSLVPRRVRGESIEAFSRS